VILVIDNYDSFTYNLVQYLGELGTQPLVRRNNEVTLDEIADLAPERIVISPGPGRPEQAGITLDVIKRFGPTTPLLGVCLGHQAIGMAYGGAVVRASAPMHGKTSSITHDGRGVFAGIATPFTVARYHSLVVDRNGWPADLEISAQTEDDGTVMALRHRRHPIHGVQFHPESILTREGHHLLRNFLHVERPGA
jgi:anthranilate synthase/aminodeoxychorismate synthase-like glutamine amidotransferase